MTGVFSPITIFIERARGTMGLYDRDYYREEDEGTEWVSASRFFGGMSVTFLLILVNVALFLGNMFLTPNGNTLTGLLAMHDWTIQTPRYWFEFLTYGFVHDPHNIWHIVGNMLVLFFFGPPIERKYGKGEFLAFYLISILVGGLVWGIIHGFGEIHSVPMLGASGAITALVILFAFNYPTVQIFLYGILPLPAWVFGVLYVIYDAIGSAHGADSIAHEVHLAGAGFAALYFLVRLNLTGLFLSMKKTFGGKKNSGEGRVRVWVEKSPKSKDPLKPDRLMEEVDRILRKINRTGEASLTDHEKAILRRASREYQDQHKKD